MTINHTKSLFFLLLCLFILSSLSAQEKHRLIFSDEIFFAPGEYTIPQNYQERLNSLSKILKEEEIAKIIIQANTDSIGTFESNEKLSYKRAESVVNYLVNKGASVHLMDIRTYGEFNPIADNRTIEGRARNRRVSIHILGPYNPDKYKIETTVRGQVTDSRTGSPLANSRILMLYLGGLDTLQTNAEGYYERVFNIKTNVEIRAYAKNYFFVSKLATIEQGGDIEVNFNLEPAILGGKMFLSDLYFKPGSAFLLPASEKALEGILSFMQYNDHLHFEIGGHINRPNEAPVSEDSPSFKLSEARAKAVFIYLNENGIGAERLGYKGYGNSEMLYPNAITELQEQMNRRVELKIVE